MIRVIRSAQKPVVRSSLFVGAIAALCLSSAAGPIGVVPGRILVKAKAGTTSQALKTVISSVGGEQVDEIAQIGVKVISVPPVAAGKVIDALRHNPAIQFAEEDRILEPDLIANDTYYGSQWHLPKIQSDTAWNTTTGSTSVVVAVLDTGVDGTHPDLAGKLVAGWNFYDNNSDTSDVYGHGTAVAGTAAAASNNGVGVAGVAWGCKVMPIRISDANGSALESTIAKAINWAADQGVRVCNLSFGAAESATVATAGQYLQGKGGVLVVSAGNSSAFMSTADNPYMLVVSATDSNDLIASFSNTGNNVDLSAPGVNIYTLVRGGGYGGWSGTSFSAPIVSGVAALAVSVQPGLSGAQIYSVVKNSADDLGATGFDTTYGAGRANATKAVALALSTPPAVSTSPAPAPADTLAPSVVISSPANGGRLSTTTTTVYVNATDNVAVVKVETYLDGVLAASSTSAPFTTKLSTRKLSSGAHILQAKAYDAAGNRAVSPSVTAYR